MEPNRSSDASLKERLAQPVPHSISVGLIILCVVVAGAAIWHMRITNQSADTAAPDLTTMQRPDPLVVGACDTPASYSFGLFCSDGSKVYYYDSGTPVAIAGADRASFTVIPDPEGISDITYILAKDKNHVYYENVFGAMRTLDDADPETFSFIGNAAATVFVKDKNSVYYWSDTNSGDENQENFVLLDGADPATFSAVSVEGKNISDNYPYAMDKNHVYYFDSFTGTASVVFGANPATFTSALAVTLAKAAALPSSNEFASDSVRVYLDGKAVADADPRSFTAANDAAAYPYFSDFYVDSSHVWYADQDVPDQSTLVLLPGADPKTFTFVSFYESLDKKTQYTPYLVDATHVWGRFNTLSQRQPVLISGADAATFAALEDAGSPDKNEGDEDFYAKDKNAVYYDTSVVPGADPATFTPVYNSGPDPYIDAKDKNHSYANGKIVK